MAEVIIQENESLENALRRFKRKVQQEDIIKEIKKHSFYMKPGEKRRTCTILPMPFLLRLLVHLAWFIKLLRERASCPICATLLECS